MAEPDKVAQLLAAGFKYAGHWQLDSGLCARFKGQAPAEPGVYIFTMNDEICYVGSAQGGLQRRLRKYDNPSNNGIVAVRIRECIAEALKSDAEVRVFTTAVPTSILWNGLPIDLIAGLEEGLIRKLQPRWNVRGLSALRKRA